MSQLFFPQTTDLTLLKHFRIIVSGFLLLPEMWCVCPVLLHKSLTWPWAASQPLAHNSGQEMVPENFILKEPRAGSQQLSEYKRRLFPREENSPMCIQSQGTDSHLPQQFPTPQSTEHRSGCKWESGLGISGFLCQCKKDVYESLKICRGNGCIISLWIHLGDGNHMVPWGYTTLDAALVHLKMPQVPETLPLLSVDVKQGRNTEGVSRGCLWKHFWPLYLKRMGMVLRTEKKKERKPMKTSTQTVTHRHHSLLIVPWT